MARNAELAADIIAALEGGVNFDITGNDGAQIIFRVGSNPSAPDDNIAAMFINEGAKTYAGAVDATALYTEIHTPHLPVYADAATAQAIADTELPVGSQFAVETTGAIHVKL